MVSFGHQEPPFARQRAACRDPFDPASVRELSDEELDQTVGGIRIYTEYESRWYGDKWSYLACIECGSEDWTITGWHDTNELFVTCTKCGSKSIAKINTH